MIHLRKNKYLDFNKKIRLYRNLHKGKETHVYSVKQNGIVIGYTKFCVLENCRFIVSQKGREKVVATKRKAVHAFVEGYFSGKRPVEEGLSTLTYNPYTHTHFEANGKPIFSSSYVQINGPTIKVR